MKPKNIFFKINIFSINYIILLIVMFMFLFNFTACNSSSPTQTGKDTPVTSTQDKEHKHDEKKEKKQRYNCPMHPTYTSDKMGECPICGMNLVPIKDDEQAADASAEGSGTEGLASVSIPEMTAKRLGLTFGTIETKPFVKDIRTSAQIVPDETRINRVTSRIDGWVEKLFVNVTGQFVKKGAPLLSIYSPELVSAQQELITAVTMVNQFKGDEFGNLARQGQNLLDASRQRLKLWEISDRQISEIEKTKKIQNTMILYSQTSGYVSEKNILPGQKIMAGEPLMVITDLSHVWGTADIYESDLPFVKIDSTLDIALPSEPNKIFSGKITFIDPQLNPITRTAKARIDILNPDGFLKPQMYADAHIKIEQGDVLMIPADAVMRSGNRDYAFVVGNKKQLLPVEIKIGSRMGDFFQLITGLYEGDQVVTSANFLIDSESSLKAALQAATQQK